MEQKARSSHQNSNNFAVHSPLFQLLLLDPSGPGHCSLVEYEVLVWPLSLLEHPVVEQQALLQGLNHVVHQLGEVRLSCVKELKQRKCVLLI